MPSAGPPGTVDALVPEWNDGGAPVPAAGFALVEGIVTALRVLAADHPLQLVLDNLHLADDASLDALGMLTAQFPRVPIQVIGS